MLLELAVGDAYGAGFEYANEMVEKYNDLSYYVQHPRHKGTRPGMYTDDTQMSIAVAELILEESDWTPLSIATKFVECFKRDEREGYAGRFYAFLKEVRDGQEFLDKIIPTSDKSGAAMRAAPIGILPTINKVLKICELQAKVTHDTEDGIRAAQAAALMAHYFIYQVDTKEHLGTWLNNHVPGERDWNEPYVGKVKAKGWMSVRAAITTLKDNDSLSEILKACIAFTGDVDTVATIALAAAAHSEEVRQDIPQHLIDTLENGVFGREYIINLDKDLQRLVHRLK